MTTTVLLGVFFDSFVVCIQSTVWWTTWGHVCSFFIWRENWFSGIWPTKYRSTTFSVSVLVEPLAPPPNFTRFLPCLCGRACSVWHFQINSLVARAAQMGVRTGATGKRPSSSWHILCRLLDTANLATLLTVAHTPLLSASRASKHHLSCMTPTNNPTPNPLHYSTLLISTKVRFSWCRFPRLIFFDKLSGQVDGLFTWTTTTTKHFPRPSA